MFRKGWFLAKAGPLVDGAGSPDNRGPSQAGQDCVGLGERVRWRKEFGGGRMRIPCHARSHAPCGIILHSGTGKHVLGKRTPSQENDASVRPLDEMLDDPPHDRPPKWDMPELLLRGAALHVVAERQARVQPKNSCVLPGIKLRARRLEIQDTGSQVALHSVPTAVPKIPCISPSAGGPPLA